MKTKFCSTSALSPCTAVSIWFAEAIEEAELHRYDGQFCYVWSPLSCELLSVRLI